MKTSNLPPQLTAQSLATQPAGKPQPSPAQPDGFESLVIKKAAPAKIIAAPPAEPKSATPEAKASPTLAPQAQSPSRVSEGERLLRPGSKLDIRV